MENDVKKAIDYSKELIEEHGTILSQKDFSDLQFSLATSYVMEGSPEYLDPAKDLYKEALKVEKDNLHQGFILNNLGMTNFYSFVIKSSEITDPQGSGLDALKPIIENFEDCIFNLKKSVHAFEQFDKKFELITNTTAEK